MVGEPQIAAKPEKDGIGHAFIAVPVLFSSPL
jgi:hypothetical protein